MLGGWRKEKGTELPGALEFGGKGKVQVHITDSQSWSSCRRVLSDHEFIFGSATERNGL